MKSKNLSENILRSVKSKGYKYIDLPSVIEANHIVQRSGENFRKFIFSFTNALEIFGKINIANTKIIFL